MGRWCYPLICAFLHLIFTYGSLVTGSPRMIALWLLCHRQSSLLATYHFLSLPAPILIPPTFAEAASFVCIFGLNGLTCSVLLFITSNFGSWYADCRAFCPEPSSYEHLSSVEPKKTTVTKRDSKTYEMSFPMPRATLRLANVIRLPVTSARIIFDKNCQHHRTRFSQNRFQNARNIQTIGRPAASSRKQTCVDNSSNVMRPSTEGPPSMPCPVTPFQNFKIQIRINFTTRPSHGQEKQHLQKAWSRNLTIRRWERKLIKMNWMDGSMIDGL